MSEDDVIRQTYFPLKRPCSSCPFLRRTGHHFDLSPERLTEIARASSFVCHKTTTKGVSRLESDPAFQKKPTIQCHGLIAVLSKSGRNTTIMSLAERMGIVSFAQTDPDNLCYDSLDQAIEAHRTGRPPEPPAGNTTPCHRQSTKTPCQTS